ncbi:MAG: hypothetical protein DFNUSKGM_002345 [Candidatus Fervidibacter sacchari]
MPSTMAAPVGTRKKGTSAPMRAAKGTNFLHDQRKFQIRFSAKSVAAPSLLPLPKPAWAGIDFLSATENFSGLPVSSASKFAARKTVLSSSSGVPLWSVKEKRVEGSMSNSSQTLTAVIRERRLWYPSGLLPTISKHKFTLAAQRTIFRPSHPRPLAPFTQSAIRVQHPLLALRTQNSAHYFATLSQPKR